VCVRYSKVLLMITRGMELSAVMVGWGGRGRNGFDGWLGGSAGARVKISSRTTPYITSQLQEKKWENVEERALIAGKLSQNISSIWCIP